MKMIRAILTIGWCIQMLAYVGCTTGHTTAPQAQPVQIPVPVEITAPGATSHATGHVWAVVAGLEYLDKTKWGGWDGKCPGTRVDAEIMQMMVLEAGGTVSLFLTEQATRRNVIMCASNYVHRAGTNDVLFLYYSGHGGQKRDLNGDETDKADETLCLYDGELTDDLIGDLLQQVPSYMRVFFITDSCHSGSNFRGYNPKNIKRAVPPDFQAQMIHYGGCADNALSFGTSQGGTFTTALIESKTGKSTYGNWQRAAALKMTNDQRPTYAEAGPVTPAFRNTPVFK